MKEKLKEKVIKTILAIDKFSSDYPVIWVTIMLIVVVIIGRYLRETV